LQESDVNDRMSRYTTGTAADLFKFMFDRNILAEQSATKMGGASGTASTAADWQTKGAEELVNSTRIIFTAPPAWMEFRRRATAGNQMTQGVFMCYNENFYNTYEKEGMVILPAGSQRAEVMTYVQIEEKFEDNQVNQRPVKILSGDA